MSGSGQEAFAEVREWSLLVSSSVTILPKIQEWEGSSPGCLEVVVRPIRRSESGR